MKEMGMTDKQFNGFIRFLIDDLREAQEEEDVDKKNERIQKILDNLQSTLED
jgi:cysteine sulfinate desulfinase/cysteine desulfurase-like protein